MKFKTIILLFLTSHIFVSCVRDDLEVDIPPQESKIVVNAMIYSGDTIRANISRSEHILNTNSLVYLNDATVKLYRNGIFVENLVNEAYDYKYKSNFKSALGTKPQVGEKYQIIVEHPKHKTATSSIIQMPEKIDIINVDVKIKKSTKNHINVIEYSLKIKDKTGKNYYVIEPISTIIDAVKNDGTEEKKQMPEYKGYISDDPIFEYKDKYSNNNFFFSNNLIEGQEFNVRFSDEELAFYMWSNGDIETYNIPTYDEIASNYKSYKVTLKIKLHSISEDTYKYIKSMRLYSATEGDPFSEPVLIYSNIKDGLGIFGCSSYNYYEQEIWIKK